MEELSERLSVLNYEWRFCARFSPRLPLCTRLQFALPAGADAFVAENGLDVKFVAGAGGKRSGVGGRGMLSAVSAPALAQFNYFARMAAWLLSLCLQPEALGGGGGGSEGLESKQSRAKAGAAPLGGFAGEIEQQLGPLVAYVAALTDVDSDSRGVKAGALDIGIDDIKQAVYVALSFCRSGLCFAASSFVYLLACSCVRAQVFVPGQCLPSRSAAAHGSDWLF
jgi:hypothetical protein